MRDPTKEEQEAFDKIRVRKAHKAMFHVTKTILEKSIQDANREICRVLLETGLVHYHQLELGEKHNWSLEKNNFSPGSSRVKETNTSQSVATEPKAGETSESGSKASVVLRGLMT